MSKGNRKRVVVSIEQKLINLQPPDKSETMQKMSEEHGVACVTAGDWIGERSKTEEWCFFRAWNGAWKNEDDEKMWIRKGEWHLLASHN